MKTLCVLRHAKSSWDDPSVQDFDRPLNGRGLRTAPLMGELIKREGIDADAIVSSPALRAKATAALVAEAAGLDAKVVFDERIYEATPAELVELAAETHDRHRSLLLVGHNPGMEGVVRFLTGVVEPMPTAALAVMTLKIGKWHEIRAGCGDLIAVYRPKEVAL